MANNGDSNDQTPLLSEEAVRKRPRRPNSDERWDPEPDSDWDPYLPYGGKVYLARRKKPDPWWVVAIEVRIIDVDQK